MFGEGISSVGDILDLAADNGIIVKSGAWYAYQGEKIGQGRENAKQYLRDNQAVCREVETKVRELFGLDTDCMEIVEEDSKAKKTKSGKAE
jgi:recombination protein RecA